MDVNYQQKVKEGSMPAIESKEPFVYTKRGIILSENGIESLLAKMDDILQSTMIEGNTKSDYIKFKTFVFEHLDKDELSSTAKTLAEKSPEMVNNFIEKTVKEMFANDQKMSEKQKKAFLRSIEDSSFYVLCHLALWQLTCP